MVVVVVVLVLVVLTALLGDAEEIVPVAAALSMRRGVEHAC